MASTGLKSPLDCRSDWWSDPAFRRVIMHMPAGELGGRLDALLRLPPGLLAMRLTAAVDTVIAAPWDHIAGAHHPPNHAGINR